MSNQNAVDLLMTGEETIIAIINQANKTQFSTSTAGLIIGAPRASVDEAYNTDIEVTFPVPPSAGDPEPDPVMGEMHYNRLDYGRLFAGKNIRLRDAATPYDTVADLLPLITAEARIALELGDIIDGPIPAGDYPKAVIIKAAPTSLRFLGQFSVELLAPIVADTSFITAPVQTANSTPSVNSLKTDGTLFAGTGEIATAMAVATNGEIEVIGAARLLKVNQGIPAQEGVYNLNIGDQADWTLPFGFRLLDTRNGDKITDLYTCTFKVTAPGGGTLDFELKRQYGRLSLVDAANQLTIEDPALYNDAQSLFQTIQRVAFYKSKLGSLDVNAAGAPYGVFEVEVKAVRKTAPADPVFVAFEVNVEGIPFA